MSYNRIVKPRFFVDNIGWLASRGWSKETCITITNTDFTPDNKYELFNLCPQYTETIAEDEDTADVIINFSWPKSCAPVSFVAILNHNMHTAGARFSWRTHNALIDDIADGTQGALTPIFGGLGGSGKITPRTKESDTLATLSGVDALHGALCIEPVDTAYTADLTIGSIIVGMYYTMPVSGDMELKDISDHSGVSLSTNPGGNRFAHAGWIGGNDDTTDYLTFRSNDYNRRMSGREILELSFSNVADTHLVPEDRSDIDIDDASMLWRVTNKTVLSLMPMIVATDSTSSSMGDYMFARIIDDSVTFNQSGHRVYNIKKLRIEQEF